MYTKSEYCCCKINKNPTKINGSFKCKCNNHSFKPSSSSSSSGAGVSLRRRRYASQDDESKPEKVLWPSVQPPMRTLSSTASSDGRRTIKRALLCGVTYKNWKHRLQGTVNDVRNMQDLLINHFGYSKQNIRILTGYIISSFCLRFLKSNWWTLSHLRSFILVLIKHLLSW